MATKKVKTVKEKILATMGMQTPELPVVEVEQVPATLQAPDLRAAVQLYSLGKLPRNGLNEGTKHGSGGTKGTYLAVCAALADGPISMEAVKTVCKDQGDAGFARYAVRNHWLLPVTTA